MVRFVATRRPFPTVETPLLPYSFQTEGKYVAYGLQVYVFLFLTLPLVVSLFLAGYLVFPSMFGRFYAAIRVLSALLAIGGFGVAALIIGLSIVNNVFPIFAVGGTSPFWIIAILPTLVFTKSNP